MKSRRLVGLTYAVLAIACQFPGGARAIVPTMPTMRPVAYGFIDRSGKVVVPPACDRTTFAEGGDWVSLERAGKQGFLNLRTRQTTGLIFDAASSQNFNGEPLFALGPEPVFKGVKYGYVDPTGRTIIPFRFDAAREFAANGLAVVEMDGRFGYINRRGDFVFPDRFEAASDFGASGLATVRLGGLWGAIDRRGVLVIPPKFEQLALPVSGNLAIVSLEGRMGAVDMHGNVVVPLKFAHIRDFSERGLAAASMDANPQRFGNEGGHWGFIDRRGQFVAPPIYKEVSDFEDERHREVYPWASMRAPLGLAEATSINAAGLESTTYLDSQGRAVVHLPAGIVGVHVLRNGVFIVVDERKPDNTSLRGRFGVFDPAKPSSPIIWFDSVGDGSGDGDLLIIYEHGLWGYADRFGSVVIEPQFGRASEFTADGLASVQAKDPEIGRYGAAFIDRTGKVKLRTPFEDASTFGKSGFARVVVSRPMGTPVALPASECAWRTP